MNLDKYIDNINNYNKLEHIEILPSDSDETVFKKVIENSNDKRKIKEENIVLLDNLLPYEKDDLPLSEDNYLYLDAFCKKLSNGIDDIDNSISFRIHKILLKDASRRHNETQIIQQLFQCGIEEHIVVNSIKISKENLYFKEIINDKKNYIFASKSSELITIFLKSLVNYMISLVDSSVDLLIESAKKNLAFFDVMEKEYPDISFNYDIGRFVTYRNASNAIVSFVYNDNYVGKYAPLLLEYSKKSLDLVHNQLKDIFGSKTIYDFTYVLCLYYNKEISLKQLIEKLDSMSKYDSKLSISDNYDRVFQISSFYLTYLQLDASYDEEQRKSLTIKKIAEVKRRASLMDLDGQGLNIDKGILSFIIVVGKIMGFDYIEKNIYQIMVYRNTHTYVHTQTVARISLVLFDYLAKNDPSFFVGLEGIKSPEEFVLDKKKYRLLMKKTAIFHDIGKYYCMRFISNSSRKLEDFEFEVIKEHPLLSQEFLEIEGIPSCVKDGALYHHLYHDNNGGYPVGYKHTNNRPFSDILTIADSIDAATDFVGRPYHKIKTLDDVIGEMKSIKENTRYSKEVVDALSNEKVKTKINEILLTIRKKLTIEAFRLANKDK